MNAPVVDVLIIGAEPAASPRRDVFSPRVGARSCWRPATGSEGRALTVPFQGHPVDLAPLDLASGINPLVRAAREGGQALSRARYAFTSFAMA